jgi:uncharacterized protein YaiE (UPF0345 family)
MFRGSGANTTSAFTNATRSRSARAFTAFSITSASALSLSSVPNNQPTPGTLNATGTLTAALILGGIVTSTTAAAVTATLDTGTVCDAALTMAVNDSFDWSVIQHGANSFTVTAATGHTIVGCWRRGDRHLWPLPHPQDGCQHLRHLSTRLRSFRHGISGNALQS